MAEDLRDVINRFADHAGLRGDGNEVRLIASALPQTAVEWDAKALTPVLGDLKTRDKAV